MKIWPENFSPCFFDFRCISYPIKKEVSHLIFFYSLLFSISLFSSSLFSSFDQQYSCCNIYASCLFIRSNKNSCNFHASLRHAISVPVWDMQSLCQFETCKVCASSVILIIIFVTLEKMEYLQNNIFRAFRNTGKNGIFLVCNFRAHLRDAILVPLLVILNNNY